MAEDIILLDGVRYAKYSPQSEDEFERHVVANSGEIFGGETIYLDIKKKIANALGEGTIPDGYLFYPEQKRFVMVEVELSSHPVYEHISKQVNKFISAFSHYRSRQKLASTLTEYIENEPTLLKRMQPLLGNKGLYQFLEFDVFEPIAESKGFEVVVIIEDKSPAVVEALSWLNPSPSLIEVALYARDGAEAVKALRFEPQCRFKPKEQGEKYDTETSKLSEYATFAKEKRLEGLTFKEIGKLWREKSGKLESQDKLDKESFLERLGENSNHLFTKLFNFAEENGYLIRWGKSGFSLNAIENGKKLPLCFGYCASSVYKESVYTGFDFFKDNIKNAESLIEYFTKRLSETEFFKPASKTPSKKYKIINYKWFVGNKVSAEQIETFLNIIDDVRERIIW